MSMLWSAGAEGDPSGAVTHQPGIHRCPLLTWRAPASPLGPTPNTHTQVGGRCREFMPAKRVLDEQAVGLMRSQSREATPIVLLLTPRASSVSSARRDRLVVDVAVLPGGITHLQCQPQRH